MVRLAFFPGQYDERGPLNGRLGEVVLVLTPRQNYQARVGQVECVLGLVCCFVWASNAQAEKALASG
jgi:hypothetical protein